MANPNSTQLAAPAENTYLRGQNVIHRYVQCEATAAAPVVWSNIKWIQSVVVGDPTYEETDVFMQGSKEKTKLRRNPVWPVTINVLNGKKAQVISDLLGYAWGSTNYVVPSNMSNDNPDVILESIFREEDNTTHVFSQVVQDLILDDSGMDIPMDYADGVINGHTYFPPFYVYTGYEAVYDVWDATPTTNTYTTSATPATAVVASSHDFWDYNNAAFIKQKDNSEGETVGNRLTSGAAIAGQTLTVTASPLATDKVYALYVKVSA